MPVLRFFGRMDHDADYGVLNDIARGQSDPRKIVRQWDEMIRTAGSLKLGKVQASVLGPFIAEKVNVPPD